MTGIKHLSTGSKKPGPVPAGKLRLYSMRFCPYAQRVHLVLDAKRVPYEAVYINLTHKPEWLNEISPLGKVPALELPSGQVLYESLIISDYLDEEYTNRPLYDEQPLKRAQDKILVHRFNEIIGAMFHIFLNKEGDGVGPILSGLDFFEMELARRKNASKNSSTHFFHGHKPGMLDYMIWPWCERADLMRLFTSGETFELDSQRYPTLLQWRAAMVQDDAVKRTILSPEVHTAYIQSKRDGQVDYEMPLIQASKKQRII